MNDLIFTQIPLSDLKVLIIEAVTECLNNKAVKEVSYIDEEEGGIELAMKITRLKKSTIYGLTSKRKIPFFKKGKILYFSRLELLEWIKSGKKLTQSEIISLADSRNSESRISKVSVAPERSKTQKKGGKMCFSPSENI